MTIKNSYLFTGCCIYEKPKLFGESSSDEDDDETDHCRGHKGKCFRHGSKHHDHSNYAYQLCVCVRARIHGCMCTLKGEDIINEPVQYFETTNSGNCKPEF